MSFFRALSRLLRRGPRFPPGAVVNRMRQGRVVQSDGTVLQDDVVQVRVEWRGGGSSVVPARELVRIDG